MSEEEFVMKAVRDPLYRVRFSYVCAICNKKTKAMDGHAHHSKKLTASQIAERRKRAAKRAYDTQRKKMLMEEKSC